MAAGKKTKGEWCIWSPRESCSLVAAGEGWIDGGDDSGVAAMAGQRQAVPRATHVWNLVVSFVFSTTVDVWICIVTKGSIEFLRISKKSIDVIMHFVRCWKGSTCLFRQYFFKISVLHSPYSIEQSQIWMLAREPFFFRGFVLADFGRPRCHSFPYITIIIHVYS